MYSSQGDRFKDYKPTGSVPEELFDVMPTKVTRGPQEAGAGGRRKSMLERMEEVNAQQGGRRESGTCADEMSLSKLLFRRGSEKPQTPVKKDGALEGSTDSMQGTVSIASDSSPKKLEPSPKAA